MGLQAQPQNDQNGIHPIVPVLHQLLTGGMQQQGQGGGMKGSPTGMAGGWAGSPQPAQPAQPQQPQERYPFNQAHWGISQGFHGAQGPLGAGSTSANPSVANGSALGQAPGMANMRGK